MCTTSSLHVSSLTDTVPLFALSSHPIPSLPAPPPPPPQPPLLPLTTLSTIKNTPSDPPPPIPTSMSIPDRPAYPSPTPLSHSLTHSLISPFTPHPHPHPHPTQPHAPFPAPPPTLACIRHSVFRPPAIPNALSGPTQTSIPHLTFCSLQN
ncbi:hypothetical protein JOL62DRAFT_114707 [Phyllosticta paracitricarpa]|uniref:Uncharacterized protein n=1 Tax=Phyllosticta paracitricarpa TaxID=2016321 RepID=A0ABR1N5E4_9PEZI